VALVAAASSCAGASLQTNKKGRNNQLEVTVMAAARTGCHAT